MPALPFDQLQALELPISEVVNGRIGYIHDLFLRFRYEMRDDLPSGDQDLVVITGKEQRQAKLARLATYPGWILLVLAPGDAPFRRIYMPDRQTLPPNIVTAYVTNNEHRDQRVVNVPLGVRATNLRLLQFVRQNHEGPRDGLLYGNFQLNEHYQPRMPGHLHIREQLAERATDMSWAKMDISSEPRGATDSQVNYYRELARHRFALSPEGHGIDCYRTWESLYLGAVPIVMTSTCTSSFADLPILYTDDYSELSEEYLEDRWQAMSQRLYRISRLLKSFYLEHFLSTVALLKHPRFLFWRFDGPHGEGMRRVLQRSSRSPSDIFLETPNPPFTPAGTDLMNPADWTAVGDLRIERQGEAIRIECGGDNGATAKFPLETIPGGPFLLTGRVQGEDGGRGTVSVRAADKYGVRGDVRLTGSGPHDLRLDFVADADRTQLVIAPSEEASCGAWLLSDLSLETTA
jgi:hypothetical protein